ncbi:MAG: hypothetical protein HUK02_02440 [Bacteroidaceae bacterium]|nr:hypothetical protein [Bacteroidaceae bacterium]
MKSKALVAACLLCAVVPILSWLLYALGLPVNNLLSDEGVRWLLLHGGDVYDGGLMVELLLLALAAGLMRVNARLVVSLVVIGGFLIGLALIPGSPLVSVTGSLWPSPVSHAAPALFAISVIAVCLVMDHRMIERRLTVLFSRLGFWLIFLIICAFAWHEITYLWQ